MRSNLQNQTNFFHKKFLNLKIQRRFRKKISCRFKKKKFNAVLGEKKSSVSNEVYKKISFLGRWRSGKTLDWPTDWLQRFRSNCWKYGLQSFTKYFYKLNYSKKIFHLIPFEAFLAKLQIFLTFYFFFQNCTAKVWFILTFRSQILIW